MNGDGYRLKQSEQPPAPDVKSGWRSAATVLTAGKDEALRALGASASSLLASAPRRKKPKGGP
jgi:hypothetical protein